jgi:hypothetical protein
LSIVRLKDGREVLLKKLQVGDKEKLVMYRKLGFQEEGTMRDSYLGEDGRYHDELVMGLIFS